jgi:hypothetical protein
MTKLSLFVVVALAACGGNKQHATDTTATKPETAAVVELAELQFFQGDDLGMKLHQNGHIEVKNMHSEGGKPATESWQDIGSIGADGTLTHDGKTHGMFKADGTFATAEGKTLPFHLDADTLVAGDKKITLDDKGVLQGGNPMPKPMRVEGATTPGLRRTALLVLALMLTADEHHKADEQKPDEATGGTAPGY